MIIRKDKKSANVNSHHAKALSIDWQTSTTKAAIAHHALTNSKPLSSHQWMADYVTASAKDTKSLAELTGLKVRV